MWSIPLWGCLTSLHVSVCVCRSSVPADQWQAATLGKAAGESIGRMGDLVTGRGGATNSSPFRKFFFSSHVSFPRRTPSSFQAQLRQPSAPCLLAIGGGAGSTSDSLALPGLFTCEGKWENSSHIKQLSHVTCRSRYMLESKIKDCSGRQLSAKWHLVMSLGT